MSIDKLSAVGRRLNPTFSWPTSSALRANWFCFKLVFNKNRKKNNSKIKPKPVRLKPVWLFRRYISLIWYLAPSKSCFIPAMQQQDDLGDADSEQMGLDSDSDSDSDDDEGPSLRERRQRWRAWDEEHQRSHSGNAGGIPGGSHSFLAQQLPD